VLYFKIQLPFQAAGSYLTIGAGLWNKNDVFV
jgi:hypothetical protein